MELRNQIAIVTGAGGGLGRSHALMLARCGASVIVNDPGTDASGESLAEQVAAEIVAAGGTALADTASVTDEDQVAAMVQRARDQWGRIDILVNNAGILRDRTFGKMSIAEFRDVFDVHVMGSVICTKAVWDGMRAQEFGRIVLTTSSSGLYGSFGQANYAAAKMALVGLMQTLALEGERYNVRVNCLAPTAATKMTGDLLPETMLGLLAPELVSPGLLPLVGQDAPTRTILCAGAGHFAAANITLTQGVQIGDGEDAADRIAARWAEITDRAGEIVPERGLIQAERELAAAGYKAS